MSLKWKRQIVLAKTETTYGQDPTPTEGADAVLLHNVTLSPLEAASINRNLIGRPLGSQQNILTGKHVKLECEVELAGSGTAGDAPPWSTLLQACAMGETADPGVDVVYSPISTGEKSITLYLFLDGNLHKITGARGSFGVSLEAGKIPYLTFSFIGLFNAPVAGTFPNADFTSWQKPVPVTNATTTTFALHGFNAIGHRLSYQHNNKVSYRDLIGAEDVDITDRGGDGSILIEAPALVSKDFFAAATNETLDTLAVVHGTTAGHIIQIDAPKVQLLDPKYGDSNGRTTLETKLVFTPSAGDDEIIITAK